MRDGVTMEYIDWLCFLTGTFSKRNVPLIHQWKINVLYFFQPNALFSSTSKYKFERKSCTNSGLMDSHKEYK